MNEFGTTAAKFYRHSGKAPILGLILIGLAGFIAVPILGLIYGVLIRVIPFIYINFFVVIGYAFAVSFVLSRVAKYGKIRNMVLLGLAAFFFGLLADYVG
jgi:fatty-acid desaturase